MHLHGNTFHVTSTEGGRIPEAAWWPGNTVLVGVAQSRGIEFVANNPGDWMIHCHLPHHMMNQMSSTVGKMTRPNAGMPAGLSMESGMGMLTGSSSTPLGDDYSASLGRGMGLGATSDTPTTNGPLSQAKAKAVMQTMDHCQMSGMDDMASDIAANANAIPNFPQDAYMEGPMMAMDKMVDKPENYGLATGWSGYMMGMMTFVRVLPPDKYDEVISHMKQAGRLNDPYASILSKA
jgi:manganese oxidase